MREMGLHSARHAADCATLIRPTALTQWEPLPTNDIVFAKSQVFGYKSTCSPGNATDISVFLLMHNSNVSCKRGLVSHECE